MILADKIIEERKKNGWSQEELAEKLGVSRQAVSKWESAQSVPDLQRVLEMSQVFAVSTDYLLKDEISGTAPCAPVDVAADSEARHVSMEQANTFLAAKHKTAPKIAAATFLCIVSPVFLLLLSAGSETGLIKLSENAAAGIGMVLLLLFVAVAVSIFISCGYTTHDFEFLESEEFETEYGVTGMVRETKQQYLGKYSIYNVYGTVLCILSVVPLFAGLIFTENGFVLVASVSLLLIIAGIGVVFFIVAGVNMSSVDKLLQEGDYTRKKKKNSAFTGAVCSAYWMAATAIYLACSFTTMDWERTWIVWPIAGVLFPAVAAIVNAIGCRRKEK